MPAWCCFLEAPRLLLERQQQQRQRVCERDLGKLRRRRPGEQEVPPFEGALELAVRAPLRVTNTCSQARQVSGRIVRATPGTDDLKRCTKCGEQKPPAEFSRNRRSRKDGRASWCKACVRRWQQDNAEHMADYHRAWQRANRDKRRKHYRRYLEGKRDDPEWRERRRANARRRDRDRRAQDPEYRERGEPTTAGIGSESEPDPSDAPPEAADSGPGA
jgi:hypothetical protein